MAVKALFAITGWAPESDGTYRVTMQIWSGTNNSGTNVLNDEYFTNSNPATTVNAALNTFVENYIQSEWSVEYNQMLDSVKCLNPVSLL